MDRLQFSPRPDWQPTVESQGFLWHSLGQKGEPYWTETAAYHFTTGEIDEIEKATYALNSMCLEAVQYVVDNPDLFDTFEIYDWMRPVILDSWAKEEFTVFGRFDLSYDGRNPPKLLEYNADTPTGLLEQSVIQWNWLKDLSASGQIVGRGADQFNSTHERLLEAWSRVLNHVPPGIMHFISLGPDVATEDFITVNYLRDTAMQAGWETDYLPLDKLGWKENDQTFRDEHDRVIQYLCKLYPWEWLVEEEIGGILQKTPREKLPRFFEAPWKALLSNKAILVLLSDMFPDSPYLLKASFDADDVGGTYVKKPQFGREGANVTIYRNGAEAYATQGEYGDTDLWVYQEYAPLPDFGGNRPVVGSWMVNGYATGVGIRESNGPVTGNFSRFVPHYFDNTKKGFFSRIFGK